MPASPISSLPADQQQELLDELNYLNIAEIKSFCKRHSIPHTIAIETKSGIFFLLLISAPCLIT